ncbi:MAG: cadherin repeat domain-containing protein, partial [Gammaproteobacteria bacterium]|nr:cadherin repeat domain-containing protein [Gammaproteobacteria bacterium]
TTITLSGSGTDSDGTISSYSWEQTTGTTVSLNNADSATATFDAPVTTEQLTLTFELAVTDDDGATNTDTIIIDIMPVITGLVVDDLLINATVKLLTFPNQEFIVETQTDSDGRYSFQQAPLPEYIIIQVTGGTLNGEEFSGTLTGLCLLSERLSCHITPISTLIMSYAEQEGILGGGDKAAWVVQLGSALNADLTTDPFIDESNTDANIENIRDFLENGVKLDAWVETVLDFVKIGTATEVIKDFFPDANIPPVVTAATFTVDENSADGTAVGTVVATDLDGDSLEWEIIAGNTGSSFAIDSDGLITVADYAQLDYETTSSYSLTVSVSDGTNTGTGIITVNLNDLNDNNPVVTAATFAVDENAANTATVGTVVAADADANTTFSAWTITAGNTDDAFAIDSASGVITVNDGTQLDFETIPSYTLTVQVSDGTLTGTGTITVDLIDLTDLTISDASVTEGGS